MHAVRQQEEMIALFNPKNEIQRVLPQVVEWRRHLHMHPELGFEERRTSELVATKLKQAGIEVEHVPGTTAILGVLRGGQPGKTIALRADMDALPISEETNCAFASIEKGKMHACGHDLHVSNLLGVATVLAANREHVPGTVKFIFQPAEESGKNGASSLVEFGVMEGVDQVYALHVHPEIPTGQISVTPGYCTANSDIAVVTVLGKGGHGAHPETTVDAIVIGAEIVGALQTIISRNFAAQEAGVVTVGTFNAGNVQNIIAERAEMRLSLRSLTPDSRERLRQRIEMIVQGITQAHGACYQFEFIYSYPSVYNDERALDRLLMAAEPVIGQEQIIINPKASMVGEDFAYYATKAPGVLFWLGASPAEPARQFPLHNPKVEFNEDCLPIGMEIMLNLVLKNA